MDEINLCIAAMFCQNLHSILRGASLPLSSSPFYLLVLMILCDLECGITFVLHVPPKLFLSSAQILVFKTVIVKLKSSAIKVELNFR